MQWTVAIGIDTHKDRHVAVALDRLGGQLDSVEVPATSAGYLALLGSHTLLAVVHATAGTAVQDSLSGAVLVAAAAPPAGPSSSAAPTVAGTVEQGSQLTGTAGSWTGSGTIAYGFNWFRCDAAGAHCLSIHGATKPTYTQGAKDAGHTLGFAVHATDPTNASRTLLYDIHEGAWSDALLALFDVPLPMMPIVNPSCGRGATFGRLRRASSTTSLIRHPRIEK